MKTLLIASIWIFTLALSYYIGTQNTPEPEKVVVEKVISRSSQNTKTIIVEKTVSKETNKEEKKEDKKITAEKIKKFLDEKDMSLNLEKFERECNQSDKEFDYNCYKVRQHYKYTGLHKKNISEDRKRCASGDAKACRNLQWDGDQKDKAFMKKYVAKQCEQNNAKACEAYADAITMEQYNKGREKSNEALQLYKKACDLDSSNCYAIATMLEGRGDERAVDYYEIGCKSGEWSTCRTAADFFFKQGKMANGESMLRSGCENSKEGGTCMEYVNFLMSNNRRKEAISIINTTCKDFSIEGGNHLCVRLKNMK